MLTEAYWRYEQYSPFCEATWSREGAVIKCRNRRLKGRSAFLCRWLVTLRIPCALPLGPSPHVLPCFYVGSWTSADQKDIVYQETSRTPSKGARQRLRPPVLVQTNFYWRPRSAKSRTISTSEQPPKPALISLSYSSSPLPRRSLTDRPPALHVSRQAGLRFPRSVPGRSTCPTPPPPFPLKRHNLLRRSRLARPPTGRSTRMAGRSTSVGTNHGASSSGEPYLFGKAVKGGARRAFR